MFISIGKKTQLYFIFSFICMILGGTVLLKLPGTYVGETPLSWIDALFTATSAVCVTGLMTVNLADFSILGQAITLLLIQLGGIGIMTLTASLIVIMGHKMSFHDTLLFANLSDRYTLRGTESLNKMVFNYTLCVEGVVALLLLPGFLLQDFGIVDSIWLSIFHAISAFCNAGISPLRDNFIGVHWWIKLITAFAIILGGIGIYVVYDCKMAIKSHHRIKIQTYITLVATVILLLFGMLLIWLLQHYSDNPLSWLDSFFLSVTSRTAGFNNIDLGILSGGAITVLMLLMTIGGAPGSTAGGMKVTTIALAVAAIFNTFKGNKSVLVRKREVPVENVLKAFSLIVTYVLLAITGGVMIHSLTNSTIQWALFESISALGTVGLALNSPDSLSMGAKLFIIVYMFLGRVGIFTIFLFLLGRERQSRLKYTQEKIIVS